MESPERPEEDRATSSEQTRDEMLAEMATLRDGAVTHVRDMDAVFDAVADPMVVYDLRTQIVRCNAAFRAVLEHYSQDDGATLQQRADGLAMRDMQGRILPPEQWPQQRMLSGEVINDADPARILTRGGAGLQGMYSVTGGPLYQDGEISGAVAFFRDITEQHGLEDDLLRANERFRLAERAANGFVYEWDVRAGVVYRSEGLERLIGYQPDEIAPTWAAWTQLIYPGDWQVATDAEALAYLQALPGDTLESEYRVRHRDGHYLTVAEYATIERDKQGRITRLIGQTNDITERKRREANLAFLAEVSHDLAGLTNIEETMNVLGEKIGRAFRVKQCIFSEHADAFETSRVAYGWNAEDARDLRGTYRTQDFLADELMALLMKGETVAVSETLVDARVSAESYGALGIRSFIIVPLARDGEGRFQISIIDDTPREWRTDEIELIREITTRIWTRLERARTEAALRESEERLRLALDASASGSFVWYPGEDRSESDARMLELFGLPPNSPLGLAQALATLIHPEDGARYAAAVARSLEPAGSGALHEDIRVRLSGGALRWLTIDGQTFFDDERPSPTRKPVRMIGMTRDITERNRMEEALRASEAQQFFLLRLTDALRPLSDPQQIKLVACELLGLHLGVARATYAEVDPTRENTVLLENGWTDGSIPNLPASVPYNVAVGSIVADLITATDVTIADYLTDLRYAEPDTQAYFQRLGIRGVDSAMIIKGGRLAGLLFVHSATARHWTREEHTLLREVAERTWDAVERAEQALRQARDELERRVAERTRELAIANDTLRRLSQRILDVQESERRLIARELHDEIGQQLTGVKMLLETLEASAQSPVHPEGAAGAAGAGAANERSPAALQLDEISDAVASALNRVRDLSLDLRPAVLDSLGLLPALQWHFERYTRQTGVQVDFSAEGLDRRLPRHLEAGVYRLTQEALTNVARHAGVSAVTAQIYVGDETLTLYVVDEGVGFDVDEALAAGASTGLAGMRERAALLGGTLAIDSMPGEGATIRADLSITQAIEEEAARESEEESAYWAWRTPETDAARHRARDELRDRARDQWRDAGRDAKRDTVRDSFRDLTRGPTRDVTRDASQDRADEGGEERRP